MISSRSPILRRSLVAILPTVLLFAVFLLFAGHNTPGGGFVAGLVAGAALVLRHLDGGASAVRRLIAVVPATVLGTGLVVAVTTGIAPLLFGRAFLQSSSAKLELPLLGTVKSSSSLAFDIGVFLVVVGLVYTVLDVLGSADAEDTEEEPAGPEDVAGTEPAGAHPAEGGGR